MLVAASTPNHIVNIGNDMTTKIIPIPTGTRLIDIKGQRFNRLTVVGYVGSRGRAGHWLCQCTCGSKHIASGSALRSTSTQSCGCLHDESATKHGMRGTPEYIAWGAMIQRCTNPKVKQFADYGGRGITVCDRWRNNFAAFYADMGQKPSGFSIDRIDNNAGYSPENCKWVSRTQQQRNQRVKRTSKTGVRGVQVSRAGKFTAMITVNYKPIHLGTFVTIEDATKARAVAESKYWHD